MLIMDGQCRFLRLERDDRLVRTSGILCVTFAEIYSSEEWDLRRSMAILECAWFRVVIGDW